jgi:hypothetical protein
MRDKTIATALVLILALAALAGPAAAKVEGPGDKATEEAEEYWDPTLGAQNLADVPESEPVNNTCPGQGFNCGDVLRPAALTAGDNDYFSFTANAGDVIVFGTDTDGSPNADTFIHLYNSASCATEVASDDDGGPGLFSLLVYCVPPGAGGTYVGRVRGFSSTTTGLYKAFVTCSSSGGGADVCAGSPKLECGPINESGNTGCATSNYTLPASNPCTGFTAAGRDVVYTLNVPAGASINLTYTSTADASFYIITDCANPSGTCVVGADATLTGQPEVINYVFGVAGTYYLILDSFGTNTSGGWTLTGTFACPPTSNEPSSWGNVKTLFR